MRWLAVPLLTAALACGGESDAERAPIATEAPPRPAEPEVDTSHWKELTLRVLGMT